MAILLLSCIRSDSAHSMYIIFTGSFLQEIWCCWRGILVPFTYYAAQSEWIQLVSIYEGVYSIHYIHKKELNIYLPDILKIMLVEMGIKILIICWGI